MNTTRPDLNQEISIKDFKNYYWLKEELIAFCRKHALPTSGGKIEIKERILEFLETGRSIRLPRATKKFSNSTDISTNPAPLSLNTIITSDYKNSEANRAFFKSVIGEKFHFTVNFMNFFKNNVGKTYGDAISEWHREHELKKQGKFKTTIGKQFEYNQYFRDFFADPINKSKSRKEATQLWMIKKTLPEARKYSRDDLKLLEDYD